MDKIRTEIVWRNLFLFVLLHFAAILPFFSQLSNFPYFQILFGFCSSYGVTAGAHRLWTHRSFKANKRLKILLMILQTIAIQNDTIEWCRDHRVHHKFADSDADPTNSRRGFFFAHIGWLMCKKHPDVIKFGKNVDMSDLESEEVLKFQRRFYKSLVILFSFIIPTFLTFLMHEISLGMAFLTCFTRIVLQLHLTWLVNSATHMGSWKPYDKNLQASDSKFFGPLCLGEGWHNFHHAFPWDYKTSELRNYSSNSTTAFIDFFAWLGWATDLKEASKEVIKERVLKFGDGSHPLHQMM